MGRLSDHLLAHIGPTAEFRPSGLFDSLRQYTPLRVMGAKVFLTSRERGSIVLEEEQSLTGLGMLTVPLLVRKVPLGWSTASCSRHMCPVTRYLLTVSPGTPSGYHPFQMLDIGVAAACGLHFKVHPLPAPSSSRDQPPSALSSLKKPLQALQLVPSLCVGPPPFQPEVTSACLSCGLI